MSPSQQQPSANFAYINNDSETGALIRAFDWDSSVLGSPINWPRSLHTTLGIILNSRSPMFLFWGPYSICFYNDAYRPSLGVTGKHPAIGMRGEECWEEIWYVLGPQIAQVLSGGGSTLYEDQLLPIYRNGQLEDSYWTYSYSPVYNEDVKPVGVFVACTETTDRVLSIKALTKVNDDLQFALEAAELGAWDFDPATYKFTGNNRLKEWFGLSKADNVDLRVATDVIMETDRQRVGEAIAKALQYSSGGNYEINYTIINPKTKEKRIVRAKGKALFNDEQIAYRFNGTLQDITEDIASKIREQDLNEELVTTNEELSASNEELNSTNEELSQSQQNLSEAYLDLRESDTRFRSVVQQAPVGICIIRAVDLYITDVNDSYLELVGKKRGELENRTIWEAIPEAAEAYAPIMTGVIDTGIPFFAREHELVLVRNGKPETVFVDFVYEPIRHSEGVYAIMVLAIEITEKVIARRDSEETEERIRLAVEAAEIGTFDLDLINRVMLTSERFDTIFGFDHHVSWHEIVAVIHPDDQEKREAAHQEAYKNGRLFYEVRVIYADHSIHWLRVQGKVYYDKDGTPARILGTLLDITDFRRLQQQKDDFISIASHELKTPITSLKASLQLLDRMKGNPSAEMLPRLIDQSNKSMGKISTLVEDLLNVSRSNASYLKLNKTKFTIADMLNTCCNHVRVAGKYTLIVSGDEQLQVNADEHAIDQVVVNFVNNAVKYAPESLEIVMMIEKLAYKVKISVTDTGPGIPADKLPHLFERYYQAEAKGFQNSGLGLGLYISSEIIKRHNGEIGVDSEIGKGSTFWFTLPLDEF